MSSRDFSAATPLLASKLFVPPMRAGLVSRPRLLERLNRIANRKLAFVSAPAGYGKTTLLAEWADRSELPVAWLALDDRDNDLARFLSYLVAAWETIEPDIRQTPLGVLVGSLAPPVDRLLSTLLNYAATRPQHFALVLDDFHLIQEPAIHDALGFILEHLPPPMHLVLSSRTDPALSLARLRGRDQVVELRADDLRFTVEEADAFLRQTAGVELPAAALATLAGRTEGWVAGLQLAALSLREGGALPRQVEAVGGTDRYVADYLAEEVLDRLPEHVGTFLLQTAILERLSGPVCNAVTGRDDGQAMLEALERANWFLVPLDNRRQWYRYHQLFAEFLGNRLEQVSAGAVASLHCRASGWYAANGFPDEAFRHAIAGRDFDRAADIAEQHVALKLAYGQYRVVEEWLRAFPEELFAAHPALGLYRTVFLLSTGQVADGVRCLEEVEQHVRAGGGLDRETRTHLARIAGTRTILACFQDDLEGAIRLAGEALPNLPENDLFFRFGVNVALGDTYRRGSQWAAAIEPYMRALTVARQAPVPFVAIHPLSALGDLCVMRGHLRRAHEFRQEALEIIASEENRLGISVPLMGWAHIRMGELLYEWNDLEAARRHLRRGLELADLGGDRQALVFGYLASGQVALAEGNLDGAVEQLHRARPLVEATEVAGWRDQFDRFQVQIWLAQGDLRSAIGWVGETRFGVDDETSYRYEVARLALARVLIAQAEHGLDPAAPDRALVLLNRLLQSAEAAGRLAVAIEALALQSLAYRAQGNSARALTTLDRALRLAEPEGYVRLFADLGPSMAALLQQARPLGLAPEYVPRLLAACGADRRADAAASPLLDPLSERELEVLRLVAAGLSNRAIAGELVIAEGTVKRHVATLYEKLGVNSRTQAVARARELRLLS